MSNLFNSIFNDATATASPLQLMLALLVSLVLGLALTWTYKYRTLYTREFDPASMFDDPSYLPCQWQFGDLYRRGRDL